MPEGGEADHGRRSVLAKAALKKAMTHRIQMRRMAAEGKSLRAISAWLKEEGHKLSHVGVKNVLSRT